MRHVPLSDHTTRAARAVSERLRDGAIVDIAETELVASDADHTTGFGARYCAVTAAA